jgi:CBS domain-containing protein
MATKVRDVMTPGAIGVDYHASVAEAAQVMREWGVGALLVVSDQVLSGLVTARDLVVRGVAESRSASAPVGPLSSGDLIGVRTDDDVAVAERLMREHSLRRLPVVDDGTVAGVVTASDLACWVGASFPC